MSVESNRMKLDKALAVVHPSGTRKPILVRLRATNREDMDGIAQNMKTGGPEQDVYPVMPSEILSVIVNVNPEKVEVVQGVKVEPFYSREKIKGFGHVIYSRNISAAEQRIIHKSIAKTMEILKSNKLKFLLPTTLEIKMNSGAMQGYCKSNLQEQTFTIGLCPKAFVDDGVDGAVRILTHEFVHPLWNFYMDDKQKTRWLGVYTSFNQIEEITHNDLIGMLEEVNKSESIKDYAADCEDREKAILKMILKWIKQIHRVDTRSLNMLLAQQLELTPYWPTNPLNLSEMNTGAISQYASKNTEEFCAESISKFLCGESLPDNILKRVRGTLKQIRPK